MTDMTELEEYRLRTDVAVRNAQALADAFSALEQKYQEDYEALANEVATLKGVIQGMQTTIGNTIAQQWGHGSTIPGE